jgi:ribosomal protein L4
VLFSAEKHDGVLWKSARNIEGMSVAPVAELNAWTILQPRAIVMTKAAIDAFRATVTAKTVKTAAKTKRTRAVKEK